MERLDYLPDVGDVLLGFGKLQGRDLVGGDCQLLLDDEDATFTVVLAGYLQVLL